VVEVVVCGRDLTTLYRLHALHHISMRLTAVQSVAGGGVDPGYGMGLTFCLIVTVTTPVTEFEVYHATVRHGLLYLPM